MGKGKIISQYTTVIDSHVDDYIKEGWQPFGNIIHVVETNEIITAMVKYGKEPIVRVSGKDTIMTKVVGILQTQTKGLKSVEILDIIREQRGMKNLTRNSLSPQLTRLKQDGKLSLNHGVWSIIKTN